MTDLETLEARIADLEATVEAQQDRINQLQTDLEDERQARKNAEARVDDLEATCEEQAALLDALRNRTDTTQSQIAELQARELEKGAHLDYEHVAPTQDKLDLPDDRLERITDDDGTTWVRLPDHEDPLDRGSDTLPTADLLPIQQLARLDDDTLASATNTRADYIAAQVWAERTTHSPGSLWTKGCKDVAAYVDASDIRVFIKSNLERDDESLSRDYAKKLAGRAMDRLRELAKSRVYIDRRTHRKDGLEYTERRLVLPSDADIPGGTGTTDDPPATDAFTG
ncbi:hypothetical protein [Halorientalis sp. IM1011]|uniref:hypothetical protein n=1 Tax=Halorientalis sp. IM1011 TaxID=1932360 RepID=UPI000A066C7B|nr:hypothetical protein [Halorientalis sp. IM1011]